MGKVRENIPAWIAFGLFLAGIAAWVASHRYAIHFLPVAPFLFAACLCAFGVWCAARSSGLHFAARHTFNLHYCLIAGMISAIWPLQLASVVRNETTLATICMMGMLASAPWTFAHLFASAHSLQRVSLALAAAATGVTLAIFHPASMILAGALLLTPLVTALLLPADASTAAQRNVSGVGFGTLAFLLFNLIALLGLGAGLGLLFYAMFLQFDLGPEIPRPYPFGNATSVEIESTLSFLAWELRARFLPSLAGLLLIPGFVYTWPTSRPSRLLAAGVTGCLVTAAMIGAQPTTTHAIPAAAITLLLLLGATAIAAIVPRPQRHPHALIAAVVAATIFLQNAAIILQTPTIGNIPWILEGAYLAILWIAAYLLGLRPLRMRQEQPPTPHSSF